MGLHTNKSLSEYHSLIDLFDEFREHIKPVVINGLPDFTTSAMENQYNDLKLLQERLRNIQISDWDVSKQVDYHVLRSEMNGVEFDHRVLKQWSRDPGFYNLTDGIYPRLLVHHSRSLSDWGLYEPEFPLPKKDYEDFKTKLKVIPKLFDQAKHNLTNAAPELAEIAIRVKEKDIQLLDGFKNEFLHHHQELVSIVEEAIIATKDFRNWLIEKKSAMVGKVGIGKENYNWWMKNVHLIPYGWDEFYTMIQSDYNRAISFLKIEENKNKSKPGYHITSSEDENLARQEDAALKLMKFLSDEEIISIPDQLEPLPIDQYPRVWGSSAYKRPDHMGFFEQTNDREPMTNISHVFFGHYYVGDRKIWYQKSDERYIRGKIRLYDIHEARSEALAFGIEEWLMQAGLFDDRPRSREINYVWQAFRNARALADLKMHNNEFSLEDGINFFSDNVPNNWAEKDDDAVWWDIEETLRAPGHSTNYIVGKNMIHQLMMERSKQLGSDFTLKLFFDEFMDGGIIPISLTRWELTGYTDQLDELLSI